MGCLELRPDGKLKHSDIYIYYYCNYYYSYNSYYSDNSYYSYYSYYHDCYQCNYSNHYNHSNEYSNYDYYSEYYDYSHTNSIIVFLYYSIITGREDTHNRHDKKLDDEDDVLKNEHSPQDRN